MKHIPNIITSLNLASGFVAIVFILNGDPLTACWILLAAMVFDFLDGFASRLLNAHSELGKELDSLADLVSFGTAPGLIIYSQLADSVHSSGENPLPVMINLSIIAVSALMPVCAGLRLARFNIDSSQKTSFKGLPSPANALAVISLVLAARYGTSVMINDLISGPVSIIIYSLALSLLMVTNIPLMSLKFTDYRISSNLPRYILIVLSILLLILIGIGGIILIIPAYIIVSVIFDLISQERQKI